MAKKEDKAIKEKNKENKVKKHFFKDFKAELKKVIWPTPKQLVNNTVAVVTIVLITAVIVFALDVMFKAMNEHGITKLQSYVVDKFREEDTTNNQSNETTSEEATDKNTEVESENNTNTEQE